MVQSASQPALTFVGDLLPTYDLKRCSELQNDRLVANLECIIADAPRNSVGKAFTIFVGREAIGYLRGHRIAALNLANNHVYDAGASVFDSMVELLSELEETQIYGVRERPWARLTLGKVTCAVIGCVERCRSRGPRLVFEEEVLELIQQARREADCVYVTPHWGKEGEFAFHPSPMQRRTARQWIDAGADGIFGHHTHTFHGYEVIQGRPVFYSLGNYHFQHEEGERYPLASHGLAIRLWPDLSAHQFACTFTGQIQGGVSTLSEPVRNLLSRHLESISADLQPLRTWSLIRWARHTGSVYIGKSRVSWGIRLRNSFWQNLPLWLVWSVLPRTLLMRIGAWFPDKQFSLRLAETERLLREATQEFVNPKK